MKVKIIKPYRDITKNKRTIEKDTEFEVSDERGKTLIKAGVAEEIKEKSKTKTEKILEEKTEEKPEKKSE